MTKDNTLCVWGHGFEIQIGSLMDNYEIWELNSHLSDKKKLGHGESTIKFGA
jgi:hypothetical protein